jgi:VanZ family protein
MWQELERLPTLIFAQWYHLRTNDRAAVLAVSLPVLFYLAKNSQSYIVNTVSAVIGLAIVFYLVLFLFNRAP